MPRAPRRCSHRDCDELMPCAVHAPVDRRPGSAARGYGHDHRQRSLELRARAAAGDWPCAICGDPIDYRLPGTHRWGYVAHHTTRDKAGPLAPAHKVCNERAGQPAAPGQGGLPGASSVSPANTAALDSSNAQASVFSGPGGAS